MDRRERLRNARLYFVVEADPPRGLEELLRLALEGGIDMAQLRDKEASDEKILEGAAVFRRLCDEHGALFILNDRPDLAVACGADGVHLGQEDVDASEARATVGEDLLIGLSTHSREQFDAGLRSPADYLSVGPVHETPTKRGRPATGLGLVRHAAGSARRAASKPFFAIGGIAPQNVGEVVGAGARRIVVVRAIRDAEDPRAAAAALRGAVAQEASALAGG